MLSASRSILGDRLTDYLLQATFFGHFCAGTDAESIRPTINRLASAGVGSILDYAAEADVAEETEEESAAEERAVDTGGGAVADPLTALPSKREQDRTPARRYVYEDEDECDQNMHITIRSIRTAAELSKEGGLRGFAAVKVTSLGKPELLLRLATAIGHNRKVFLREAFGLQDEGRGLGLGPEGQGGVFSLLRGRGCDSPGPIPDVLRQPEGEAHPLDLVGGDCGMSIDREAFVGMMTRLPGIGMDEAAAARVFDEIDTSASGTVDGLEWSDALTSQLVQQQTAVPSLVERLPSTIIFSEEERALYRQMVKRAATLAAEARERGVRIMFDAEQSYLQPAIDFIVASAQLKHNQAEPVVYNTYQSYLKDAHDRLLMDVVRAERAGVKVGAKLVRGAYLVQERRRAEDMGYESPIHDTIDGTHASYRRASKLLVGLVPRVGAEVMVASHNEDSVADVVRAIEDRGIDKRDGGVFFGQLLGMCDHISLTLGHKGYAAYKYVPYGPVKSVVPYLVRRAEENSSMLSAAPREISMRWQELKRRAFG